MPDWSLRFAPPVPGLAVVLAAAAAVLLFVWAYRRTAAEAGKGLSRVLLALRIIAIGLVAMALLAPVLRTYVWAGERGAVAFLLDDSESLSIPDVANRRAGRGEGVTRAEALRSLVDGKRGLARRLARTARVRRYAFGAELRELGEGEGIAAREGVTDIAAALGGAPSAAGADGARLVALCLVSDGADTEGGDAAVASAVSRLASAGLPVYTVAVGGSEFRDVEVADVRASRTVRKDTLVSVTARVRSRGMEAAELPVRLVELLPGSGSAGAEPGAGESPDGSARERVIAERPVKLGEGSATVTFEFLPAETGFREYAVDVPVVGAREGEAGEGVDGEGEAVSRNNRREFALTVERRKVRVLYMEGSEYRRPNRKLWEHQFLEEALHEDGDIEVTTLLRKEVERAREAGVYTVQDPEHGFPRTRKGLFEYDVIISSDIDIDFFTTEHLENTVEFVGKRGGGFVMIGGWTAYGAGGYDESIVDKMLPVDMMGRGREGYKENEEFRLQVTGDGLRHPLMQLDENPERNRAIWEMCPFFKGHNQVQRAKPAATVLATHDSERTLYGYTPILVVQQYGRGRSMAMTTDSTAGWGEHFEEEFGEDGDNRYFKKFWQNAVRWLAEYRLKAPSRLVQLELPGALFGRGEKVRARVTVLDEGYEPASGADVRARVVRPTVLAEAAEETTRLAADPAKPGEFVTDLVFTELGRHTIEVTASLEGERLGTDKVAVSVRPPAKEFERPEADHALLRRVAERTGGKFYTLDEARHLPEDVGDLLASVRRHEDDPLWDSWWVWGALVAALCAEWVLRKRAGLP